MAKFKVGDVVRRIEGTNDNFTKGSIGEIVRAVDKVNYDIKLSNGYVSIGNFEAYLELVKKGNQMTAKFKVGDRVNVKYDHTDQYDGPAKVVVVPTTPSGFYHVISEVWNNGKGGELGFEERFLTLIPTKKYNVVETISPPVVPVKKIKQNQYYVGPHGLRSINVRPYGSTNVSIILGGDTFTKEELRDAAILFNELADGLEEVNKK